MTRKNFSGLAFAVLAFSVFGQTNTLANNPITIKDSNRKTNINSVYQVTFDELSQDIINQGEGFESLRIDEFVLHGDFVINNRTALAGEVFTQSDINNGAFYTPELDFQGADHFKWQAWDGVNWSNISSFNFDIIGTSASNGDDADNNQNDDNSRDNPSDNNNSDDDSSNNSDNDNGSDQSNGGDATNPVNNQDDNSLPTDTDENFGIGGGGDNLIPASVSTATDPTAAGLGGDELIRTGGYTPTNNLPSLLAILGTVTILAIKRINSK